MKRRILLKEAKIVNENKVFEGDLLICGDRIEKIDQNIHYDSAELIDCKGNFLLPGCIDDQVHFREPGLTHKANIWSESRAAVAGGITSFMEMPNTKPATLTHKLLEDKYEIAKNSSMANYSFFMGTSNDNYDEIMSVNYKDVCGLKIFMGSSTGNLLVDDENTLTKIFKNFPFLIATHCENEKTIIQNTEYYKSQTNLNADIHPIVRSREACYISSSFATELAKKFNTRLHILHISTAEEVALFSNDIPLSQKRITAEACVHHLFFEDSYYKNLGNKIKCNPAIKSENDKKQIALALSKGTIDVVATDHAPHTIDEKNLDYWNAPSGLPLVQHSLQMMNTLANENSWNLEFIVEKMCHNPALCFQITDRGFIREGYFADLILFDNQYQDKVKKEELLYKCQWSPLEGITLTGKVMKTFVNGTCVYSDGKICNSNVGKRLQFNR